MCNGGSEKNVWEAYRVVISFIIKTGTLESKVSAICNCSGTNRHKPALVLHVCRLRAVECSALVWTLRSSFSWGSSRDSTPTQQHEVPSWSQDGIWSKERVCTVYRLLRAWSLFLPACLAEIEIPLSQWRSLIRRPVHLRLMGIWSWPLALHWQTISLRTQGQQLKKTAPGPHEEGSTECLQGLSLIGGPQSTQEPSIHSFHVHFSNIYQAFSNCWVLGWL